MPTLSFLVFEFIWINLILGFFNLIPVPPLDGSKILFAILPAELAYRLRPIEQYGFLLLVGIMFLAPALLNVLIVTPAQFTLRALLGVG